jgi:hypothetical protein
MTHINITSLEMLAGQLQRDFWNAAPFPHIIVDNFLTQASYETIRSEIDSLELGDRSSDLIFARNKFENPNFDAADSALRQLRDELTGTRFKDFLSSVYKKEVFVDPAFVGGGVHKGGSGSFLDLHADFSRHPITRQWLRELNILIYFNDGHKEEWGGHLDLVHAETRKSARVQPLGNRAVIMLTKNHTLHGYKTIDFPRNRFRTSIAAYAYSVDNDFRTSPDRSTLWNPQDAGAGKRLVAAIMPTLVAVKNRLLGSTTAKRAKRD